jgi:hypothetical protein
MVLFTRADWEDTAPEAEKQLFSSLPHQRLLLEYDTPRAGGFEPPRFV